MAQTSSTDCPNISVRPCHYGDLEGVEALVNQANRAFETKSCGHSLPQVAQDLDRLRQWYGLLKLLSWFPNPLQHFFSAYVAELDNKVCGLIQVAPCNRTRSTWRIERVAVESIAPQPSLVAANNAPRNGNGHKESDSHPWDNQMSLRSSALSPDIASQLLRHCLETIWEARTWMVEVSVNDTAGMGLYRQHGFQPLAQMTYWAIAPELLTALAERDVELPNLRPVSNADASLLYQLDTVSMPPLVRQVYDRHVVDFKTGLAKLAVESVDHLLQHREVQRAYVFEPQRKTAIGYFRLDISQDGQSPHQAQLTVHPAYTWLYPKLLAHMARLLQGYPSHSLQIASSDYQTEREEYLTKIAAERIEHTLMMSRSVWHKVRETKPASLEGLQLAEVLQGLKPSRNPVPGRFSLNPPFRPMPLSEANLRDVEKTASGGWFSQDSKAVDPWRSPGDSTEDSPSENPSGDCYDSSHWPTNGTA